ncbi:MAG: hypothetical protein H6972_05740 [Gammaproteobacteria bacterium]|nr:hypothetical protein [Gammaproteobacteria bacterium]
MLTVTGAQFGLRATVPAMAGILAGMSLLIGLAGAGVATLLLTAPDWNRRCARWDWAICCGWRGSCARPMPGWTRGRSADR